MAKKAAAAPDYLTELGIAPQTQQAISQMYAPLASVPSSTLAALSPQQAYATLASLPISPTMAQAVQQQAAPQLTTQTPSYGVDVPPPYEAPPIITQPAPLAGGTGLPQGNVQPPPQNPPNMGSMDWSTLNNSLQGLLAPYLSGQASLATPGAATGFNNALMSALLGYMGTIPSAASAQTGTAATPASGSSLGTADTSMNWSQLASQLRGALSPQLTGGQGYGSVNMNAVLPTLLSGLSGYMGSLPTNPATPMIGSSPNLTALGAINSSAQPYLLAG